MESNRRKNIYNVLVIAFAIAALYHLAAMISPHSFPESPSWRHVLFIFLNITGFILSLRQWKWFWVLFSVFTVQQLMSHGTRAYDWWTRFHQIDIISLVIIVGMPVLSFLLFKAFKRDLRNKRE